MLTATKSPKKTKKLLTNVLIGLIIVLTATENVVENKKSWCGNPHQPSGENVYLLFKALTILLNFSIEIAPLK